VNQQQREFVASGLAEACPCNELLQLCYQLEQRLMDNHLCEIHLDKGSLRVECERCHDTRVVLTRIGRELFAAFQAMAREEAELKQLEKEDES